MMVMIFKKENAFSQKHLIQSKDAKYGIRRKVLVFSVPIGGSKHIKDVTQLMTSVEITILKENVLTATRDMILSMANANGRTTTTINLQTLDVRHGIGITKFV